MNILELLFKRKTNNNQTDMIRPESQSAGIEIIDRKITSESKKGKQATFLCIADTHGMLLQDKSYLIYEIQKCGGLDAIVVLGDVRKSELDIICEQADDIPIYGIKGNHDDEDQFDGKNVIDINGNMYHIGNVNIIGIEGSIKYKPTAIGYTQEESLEFAKNLQGDADIVFSHSHAWRDSDKDLGIYNVHIGLYGTRYYMNHNNCINIYGHDHISTEMINYRECRIYGLQRIVYYDGKILTSFI